MTGFIVANSIAGALAGFPERAGAVSALVGALQYGSGILGSLLVGVFADGTPWPLGWVVALSGLGTAGCAWLFIGQPDGRRMKGAIAQQRKGWNKRPSDHCVEAG
ncbi:MAG: hypothetical protein QM796_13590 [Chthoniobacteraceae bacterium]